MDFEGACFYYDISFNGINSVEEDCLNAHPAAADSLVWMPGRLQHHTVHYRGLIIIKR